jgi:hypothetical protein
VRLAIYLLCFFNLLGCASTVHKTYSLDSAYRAGLYDELITELEKNITHAKPNDVLMWELNLALAYQAKGEYQKSNNVLFKIKEQINWHKTFNLKGEALRLLLKENAGKFNLAEYEQFLIQVYVTLNFAYEGKWSQALVEMRAMDLAFYNLKSINQEFSMLDKTHLSYLSGVIYEANYKFDEAFIDYQRVLENGGEISYLKYDLFRTAWLSGRYQLAKEYQEKFNLPEQYVKYITSGYFKKQGEVIVIFQNGMAPYKGETAGWTNTPTPLPRLKEVETAELNIDYEDYGTTIPLVSIERLAVDLYNANRATYLARDIARTTIKDVASVIIGAPAGLVGIAAMRTIAQSSSENDLRSWFLLPAEIQIARIRLSPGEHRVKINFNAARGLGESRTIKVKGNSSIILPFKYGNSL